MKAVTYDAMDSLIATDLFRLVPQEDFGEWDEHKWAVDEDGELKEIWWGDYHGGPVCEQCGESYCKHCTDAPQGPCSRKPARYSRDILSAMKIVSHEDGWGHDWLIERHMMSSAPWYCRAINLASTKRYTSFGNTLAMAICAVAVKILEERND